ncbi:hypothetical protein HNR22_002663 [Micromonospora jinlongensis]|uniref:Uncharacterized protein n=1 Tax=Micromonospora jinlongensis TaxID=1287877 RepID=A0A7Y9X0F3_9ACTN|nr:hypothetical protein [Micromonospora jinlongensis]NYH42936.1 hypothetical protein [Micromonospora jinlongensis]
MGLADALAEWTDVDGAQYELGRATGLFADRTFLQVKWVLWSSNPLGQALYDMLHALVRAGVLEYRDEPDHQFRWRTAAPIDGLDG